MRWFVRLALGVTVLAAAGTGGLLFWAHQQPKPELISPSIQWSQVTLDREGRLLHLALTKDGFIACPSKRKRCHVKRSMQRFGTKTSTFTTILESIRFLLSERLGQPPWAHAKLAHRPSRCRSHDAYKSSTHARGAVKSAKCFGHSAMTRITAKMRF